MRRAATFFIWLAVLTVTMWASLQTFAQQETAREFVENMLEDLLAAEGRSVSITGLGVGLDGAVTVTRAEIKDGASPWIVLEDLAVVWQPLSLFSKQLAVDEISVKRISIDRMPQAADSGVETPKEFSGLTAAKVEKLTVGELDLGPSFIGERARLKIDGTIDIVAEPAEIKLSLNANRIDDKQGTITADVTLDPQNRNMNVAVSLKEPDGGILAQALRLRGEPSVYLALKASGKFDDWKGTVELKLDDANVFDGEASAKRATDGTTVTATGQGEASHFVPLQLAPLVAGTSQLDATLVFPSTGGSMFVDRLTIDQESLKFQGAGPVDWSGDGTELALSLTSKRPDAVLNFGEIGGIGAVTATGAEIGFELKGNLGDPRWSGDVMAASLVTSHGALRDGRIVFSGTGLGVASNPATLTATAKGVVEQGTNGTLPPAVLGDSDILLTASRDAAGGISFEHLDVTTGQIVFTSKGKLEPETGLFSIDINGKAQSPQTGIAAVDALLTGDVRLSGKVSSGGSGAVTFDNFSLASDAVTTTLTGAYDPANTDLSMGFQIENLARVDNRLSGAASGSATLKGPRDALDVAWDAKAPELTLLDKAFVDAKLDGNLMLKGDKVDGLASLSGQLDGKDVTLGARLETADNGTRILRDFRFASGQSTISGEFRLPPSGRPTGTLAIASPDLTDLGPLLLIELSGALTADVRLADDDTGGSAAVDFSAKQLVTPWFAAARADGDLSIASVYTTPVPNGSAKMTNARISDLKFASLGLTAKGETASRYDVSIDAKGDLDLAAKLQAQLDGAEQTYRFAKLEGAYRSIAFAAAEPVEVVRSSQRTSITQGAFRVGSGQVKLTGTVLPALDAKARVDALPLTVLQDLVKVPGLGGTLTGDATLTGKTDNPDIRFVLSGKDVRFQQLTDQGIKPLTFKTDGTLKSGTVAFSLTGDAGKTLPFTAKGSASAKALDIAINGQTDTAFLADRLLDQGIRLEANSRFDMRVRGTPDAPQFDGTVVVSKATAGDAAGKLIIRDANGRATITNNMLRIEQFSGRTGKKGRASLSGSLGLNDGFDSRLALRIEDGIYTDGSFVVARYDANLTLTGPLAQAPVLGGEIVLRKTNVTLSAIPKSALAAPAVKHRNPPVPVLKQARMLQERQSSSGGNLRLAVKLRAANPITVSGRGLNVALGGQLQLAGSLDNIQAQGAFRLIRGSMKFLVRTLQFESGRLDFENGLDPRIDFRAVSRQPDATIELRIAGRASAPDISVTSSPQMAEEEALARLIFDRSMLQLSPLQIAQIASYVATLSGGSDTGLLTGLQNALGADWLDVVQTDTGETAISVGKRINDRLSVGVEQTTKSNTSRVNIDLGVSKSVKMRGSYGTDGESRAGVFFEKDY